MQDLELKHIEEVQRDLVKQIGFDYEDPIDEYRSMLLAATVEVIEALNELNWKPWKFTNKEVNRDALCTELTDILQFAVNAMQAVGITFIDLYGKSDKLSDFDYRTAPVIRTKLNIGHYFSELLATLSQLRTCGPNVRKSLFIIFYGYWWDIVKAHGFSSGDLAQALTKKWELNFTRVKNGY